MSSSWHEMADGRKVGPLTWAERAGLVRSGRIPPSTLVKELSRADWIPAVTVAAFFSRPPEVPIDAPPVIPAQRPASPVAPPTVDPSEPTTADRVHPLTWMAVGGGAIAVMTLIATTLGFFHRPASDTNTIPTLVAAHEPPHGQRD